MHRDRLSGLHVMDLGFLEVGDQVQRLHRHHGQQPRTGLSELTHPHAAIRDPALQGADNGGVVQIQLRLTGTGLCDSQLRLVCCNCALRVPMRVSAARSDAWCASRPVLAWASWLFRSARRSSVSAPERARGAYRLTWVWACRKSALAPSTSART